MRNTSRMVCFQKKRKANVIKPQTDLDEIKLYRARRKEIAARYYQRHRKVIKLAMTLDMSMKQARAIAQEQVIS
jgi:hypothetical protein